MSHAIVFANEKGGTGKSTAAMHVIVALLKEGLSVASCDFDFRQGTLSRYIENRINNDRTLRTPTHMRLTQGQDEHDFKKIFDHFRSTHDVIVIDTPGFDSPMGQFAHQLADTLVTPLNDSFIDLDVLARVDGETMRLLGPSHYSENVWKQRQLKAREQKGAALDWIIMRNRLSHLEARNKQEMQKLLIEMSKRMGCRFVNGFGERVIFRELFLKGLTMMDVDPTQLSMSHVAARQEVRNLIDEINVKALRAKAS